MSLIQEALEKAGRLKPVELDPLSSGEGETVVPLRKETGPVKIAVKADPLWRVNLKVKLLKLLDGMRIAPARRGEPGKAVFMAVALIVLFFGSVIYVHNATLKSPDLNDPRLDAAADPVSQTGLNETSIPNFELTGITLSGETRLALINNQVAGVGEKLKEDATVLEIQNHQVLLDFQGKRIALEL